jgi:hypothetical protein
MDANATVLKPFCFNMKYKELEREALEPTDVPPGTLPSISNLPCVPFLSPDDTYTPIHRGIDTDTEVLKITEGNEGSGEAGGAKLISPPASVGDK